jgi:hypothetical protein
VTGIISEQDKSKMSEASIGWQSQQLVQQWLLVMDFLSFIEQHF